MKKTIEDYLEYFREKDLKRYAKIVNTYFRRKWGFIFLTFFAACSVQNEINRDDFKKMPKTMSIRFYDKLDTIQHHFGNQYFSRSLINEFSDKKNIDYAEPLELKIDHNDLYIKFQDTLKKQFVIKVSGKHYKNRFVFYTNYETISFPILFITKQMTKYTVEIPNNETVLFKRSYTSEGMALLFGAGHSSENEYIFKIIKDE